MQIRCTWNNSKCRCECKELINKGICDKGFIWNPSNCECVCRLDAIVCNNKQRWNDNKC